MIFKHSAAVICLLTLASCSSFSGSPEPAYDPNEDLKKIEDLYSADAVANYMRGAANPLQLRNQIVMARMYAVDVKFNEYQRGLIRELRLGDFGGSFASIVLGGVAQLISPVNTKNILIGVDTGLKATKDSFTEDLLLEQSLQILITQMKANRARVATRIWKGLSKPDPEYPLQLALFDLQEYYDAGTLTGAIQKVNTDTGIRANLASAELQNTPVRIAVFESDQSDSIKNFLTADPNLINQRVADAEACLRAQGVALSPFEFIDTRDAAGAPGRSLAACLKIPN